VIILTSETVYESPVTIWSRMTTKSLETDVEFTVTVESTVIISIQSPPSISCGIPLYVVTVGTFGAARLIDRCWQRPERAETNALGLVSVATCLPVLDVMSLPWSNAEELVWIPHGYGSDEVERTCLASPQRGALPAKAGVREYPLETSWRYASGLGSIWTFIPD
jgi:hypothetical protein